jgi:hypothetical protein
VYCARGQCTHNESAGYCSSGHKATHSTPLNCCYGTTLAASDTRPAAICTA